MGELQTESPWFVALLQSPILLVARIPRRNARSSWARELHDGASLMESIRSVQIIQRAQHYGLAAAGESEGVVAAPSVAALLLIRPWMSSAYSVMRP